MTPKIPRRISFVLLAICAIAIGPFQQVDAAEDQLKGLPKSTLMVARIPDGTALNKSMQGTQLGQVMMSKKRWESVSTLFQTENKEAWTKIVTKLQAYGLAIEDLPKVMAGDMGMAISIHDRKWGDEKMKPLFAVWLWATPEKEVSEKLWAGYANLLKEIPEKERPVSKQIQLGDQPVWQLTSEIKGQAPMAELPENFDEMTPDQIQAYFKKRREAKKNAGDKEVKIDQANILFTRKGQRLIAVVIPRQSEGEIQRMKEQKDAGAALEWGKITGLNIAKAALTDMLSGKTSHQPFASKKSDLKGQSLFELNANLKPLMALAAAEEPKMMPIMKDLGLDKLSGIHMHATDDGKLFHSRTLIESAAPHQGLMKVFAGTQKAAEIPDWVSGEAMAAGYFDIDLGSMWDLIKTVVIKNEPDAQMGMNMAELQLQTNLGVDIKGLLNSLGTRHFIIQYPFNKKKAAPAAPAAAGAMGGLEMMMAGQQRTAVVWKLKDDKPWKKLFTLIQTFGLPMNKVNKNGFEGYAMGAPLAPMEMGFYLGKGHMVMAIGDGAADKIIADLNPAQGKAVKKMKDSAMYKKLKKEMGPTKGIWHFFTDSSESGAEEMLTQMAALFLEGMKEEGMDATLASAIMKVIPTKAELKGAFGQAVETLSLSESGIEHRTVTEMPKSK